MTPLPGGWRKTSRKRLNSEINKSPPPTTKETTSSPDSAESVEKVEGLEMLTPEEHKERHPVPKQVPKQEPIQVPFELPSELIFGFKEKKVKFISEERLNAVIDNVLSNWDGRGIPFETIKKELKKELGLE